MLFSTGVILAQRRAFVNSFFKKILIILRFFFFLCAVKTVPAQRQAP
jgi:hypothetical protein